MKYTSSLSDQKWEIIQPLDLLQNSFYGKLKDFIFSLTQVKSFYSVKKKRHTLKTQLIVEQKTGQIICTFFGQGQQHDFALFKSSGRHFHPLTESLQDSGYQGIKKYHHLFHKTL